MKNRSKVISIIIFLSAFIMLISFGEQKAEWKGKIEVENGIKVIKNPKGPMYRDEAFSLEEDLKIGEAVGDENYMFSQIRHLAVDKSENIYVSDTKEMHIKVFDKNGKFLRVFGKAGQGPGEIGRITNIQLTAKNELLVNDGRNRKIQYFSLDGEFIRSKDIGKIRALGVFCDSNENYYIATGTPRPPNPSYELLKYDSDMNLITTIAKIPAQDPAKPLNPLMLIFRYQVMDDNCLLYGYPASYELQIFNPKGKVIKKIIRDYNPVPVSEVEKEEWQKSIRLERKIEFPRYHPAFTYFIMDDERRIFVHTWEKPDSGEGYFSDVFDSDGRYLAKIPLKFRPLVLKKRKIYTIEEDEEGYQYIKRYKVTWKY